MYKKLLMHFKTRSKITIKLKYGGQRGTMWNKHINLLYFGGGKPTLPTFKAESAHFQTHPPGLLCIKIPHDLTLGLAPLMPSFKSTNKVQKALKNSPSVIILWLSSTINIASLIIHINRFALTSYL